MVKKEEMVKIFAMFEKYRPEKAALVAPHLHD